MKNYIVGYLSFFEYDLKLLKIESDSPYEAVKKAMILLSGSEESKKEEEEWQKSEDYPKDYDSLISLLYNSDIAINIIEL